ncbi:MAG: type IV toxin-antitoxin system AbiEi family antitoxin [Burkholderiales bacterium]|nr:type IV toxin-antitoxin system AbiEi family antitoxin [Burkholderiales bacterium]
MRLAHGKDEALYAVELKRAVRPGTLGGVLHELGRLGKRALLVTDYVTPQVAEALRARRVQFIDTAGNAYLEHPGLLVWVKGQKPAARLSAPRLGRAFQPTGLQVLFTLLCDPEAINRPYRELAAMAGVAHGTVGWVIPDLQRQGFVAELKRRRRGRRLYQRKRLLAQWVDAYARLLRPRTLIGRYYVPTLEGWRDWPLAQHEALWGGEPAAALLTEYLRPGELTIYAAKLPGLLAAQKRFQKGPAPGQAAAVDVRRRFWNFPGDPDHPDLTPPVLVYADLLATGDARCMETAQLVYDAHVARLLDEA